MSPDAALPAPDPLRALIQSTGGVAVIDGGLATQLEAQGNDLSDALWSARLLADDPAQIEAAHLAYFRAGARVAITASYQASFQGFERRGIAREGTVALLRRSVSLAAAARERYRAERAPEAPGPLLVAASIGPYGAALADGSEYRGRYGLTVERLRDWHRERLFVLAAAGADVLACETIPELEEAVALVELLDETPGAAAWVSFTCADDRRLRSGVPIEEAVSAVTGSPRVVAVGVNCTRPEHVEGLVGRIRVMTPKPIVVYPNSGEGWDAAARRWVGVPGPNVDPETARRWEAAGASLVGGCCRVGPDRIAEIAAALGS